MKSKIQKVKLIVSDLDGTLLQNGAQALEERAIHTLRQAFADLRHLLFFSQS